MSLRDRIFSNESSRNEGAPDDIDYWTVRWMPWDSDGGYRSLDDWKEMDDHIDRQAFEWNVENPDPGRYRLFAVKDKRFVRPPDEFRWKWEVGGPSDSPERSATTTDHEQVEESLGALQEKLEEIEGSIDEAAENPERIQAQIRARVLEIAVQNEHFMARHGDKLALAAMDAYDPRRHEPEYEDWKEDPMAATFFTITRMLKEDPESMKSIGANLGLGIKGVKQGLSANGAGSGWESTDEGIEEQTNENCLDSEPLAAGSNGTSTDTETSDSVSDEAAEIINELDGWSASVEKDPPPN